MVPRGLMPWVRKWVYKAGFRPRHTSIFYSPSLAWHYYLRDWHWPDK